MIFYQYGRHVCFARRIVKFLPFKIIFNEKLEQKNLFLFRMLKLIFNNLIVNKKELKCNFRIYSTNTSCVTVELENWRAVRDFINQPINKK